MLCVNAICGYIGTNLSGCAEEVGSVPAFAPHGGKKREDSQGSLKLSAVNTSTLSLGRTESFWKTN